MDIDTNTDGKDGDTTSNSVENINGYNVFTDEYYDNVEKVALLESNKVADSLDAVYSGRYEDDTIESYMTVMKSAQIYVVRNDYGKANISTEISPLIWVLIGAGLTALFFIGFNMIKKYIMRKK